jgi:hypothetical protein
MAERLTEHTAVTQDKAEIDYVLPVPPDAPPHRTVLITETPS